MTDINQIMMMTTDAQTLIDGKPVPALTAMLYRVCDNDPERFDEACRLVKLFIERAQAEAWS